MTALGKGLLTKLRLVVTNFMKFPLNLHIPSQLTYFMSIVIVCILETNEYGTAKISQLSITAPC